MSHTLDKTWFTEIHAAQGSAFSMQIKAKLHEEQTPYQRLEIYDTETFGKLMVIDDCVMLTERDNFLYHEMMSHPALFTHQRPEKVVIIGGGDCGTLREVLKHPGVQQVWQIDIDEGVTRLAKQYFPELCESNHDPRAQILFSDGILWMKEVTPASLDIIIVDSTDPVGPAEGLFTESFYRSCLAGLRNGGLLIQQSESPLYHMNIIKSMHDAMRQAGFSHTQTLCFPQACYPSGWWSATLAGKDQAVNTFRTNDAANKVFATHYYNADIHQAALAMPEFMLKALAK